MLLAKKIIVSAEYLDFLNVFPKKLAEVLPKRTQMNKHAIELEDGKQPPYGPIYSLSPVELKTLKTYIETNLTNSFIQPSKFPNGILISFGLELDGSLWLRVNYQGLNNLTIKNCYLLLLIYESLNRLEPAKYFTQLNLTSAYHRIRIKEGDK